MAENETAGRNGGEAQGGGQFVIRPAETKGQTHRRAGEAGRSVGGFIVTEAADEYGARSDSETSSVSVEQPLPRARRCSLCGQEGHTARNCTSTNVTRTAPKAPSGAAISVTAPLLVGTFNLMVIESMGENCGITEKEAQFLIPSTQRTLERMPKGAAEKLAVVIDPAIIVAVMAMWIKRIGDIKRAEALQKYAVAPREQARANGVSGTEHRVEPDSYPVNPVAAYVDNGMSYAVTQSDWSDSSNYVPPANADVPMPEHPDYTANGVPSAIRESFDSSL